MHINCSYVTWYTLCEFEVASQVHMGERVVVTFQLNILVLYVQSLLSSPFIPVDSFSKFFL